MKQLYEDLDKHVQHIIDLAFAFEYGKVHILTGGNATGKSMIRRLISVEDPDGNPVQSAQTSMQQRTSSNPEWGALSSAMQDLSWIATSMNSWSLLKQLLEIDDRFVILDEPEIGMSRELQLGVTDRINASVADKRARGVFKGLCVITHSEFIVRNIVHDKFINIEGMTEAEWLTRKIEVADPEEVAEFGGELFKAVQARIDKNRENK